MNNYWDAPYRWNGVMQSPGAGGSVAADNMLNVGPQGIPAVTAPAAPQAKPNNGGGAFWKILGTIGDGLAVAGGAKPVYMPAMLDLQEKVNEERKTQAALAQQAAAYAGMGATPAEVKFLQSGGKWSDIHPAMGEFERTLQASGIQPGTAEWQANMARRRDNMLDPITSVPLPNGEIYMGPRSGLVQAATGLAPSAPDMPTINSPSDAMKLPPGTRFRMPDGRIGTVPGGPTQPASGGFR
jgi:hypothetical protein